MVGDGLDIYRLVDGLTGLQDKLQAVVDIKCDKIAAYHIDSYHKEIVWTNNSLNAVNRFYSNDFSMSSYDIIKPEYTRVVA